MTGSPCIVAVDVGNSAVKLSAGGTGLATTSRSVPLESPAWPQQTMDWVRDQLGCQQAQWRIASVHRTAAEQLGRAISAAHFDARIHLVTRHDVPMRLRVDHPDRVGIDRLLSAWAASRETQRAVAVVDAGSAVTVDWIDASGEFQGGAILPGLNLQTASLAVGTDALPQIAWADAGRFQVPAKNTADAIRLGVLAGTAGAIDRLIDLYAQSLDEPYDVFLTGGDSAALSPHLRREHRQYANFVCRALLELPLAVGLESK